MLGRLLLVLLLTACAEPKYLSREDKVSPQTKAQQTQFAGKTIWLTWEVMPTDQTLGSFVLKVGRANLADQSPIPEDIDGDVEVELWMPSMGHGSSPPVVVQKVDTGTYRATDVFFTMTGDWHIRVQRFVNGVMVEQATIPIRI